MPRAIGSPSLTSTGVLEGEVLIRELLSVDGLATSAVAAGEVTALAHELCDDAVESATLEVERLARPALALLSCNGWEHHQRATKRERKQMHLRTGAQRTEVLGSLGDNVGAELQAQGDK